MQGNQKKISSGGVFVFLFLLLNAIVLERGLVSHPNWYKLAYVSIPLLLISIVSFRRKEL
jgi:hypothetical protein